jgi:hypothetical protein
MGTVKAVAIGFVTTAVFMAIVFRVPAIKKLVTGA